MADFARSDHAGVQAQLDRLMRLSPGADILGLDRIQRLLAALGNPERRLPPLFHVAGTNGKGSVCAVLRAALEGDAKRVHCYTSPHLVRFNERIRISGTLIDDDRLAHYLAHVLDHADDIGPSFFEATTAAAFLAFAEEPADACVIEVGLGGRLDATNVIPFPAVCGIAQLGVDHEAFLGSDPAGIAREKAGIARANRPLVTMAYPLAIREAVAEVAHALDARLVREGADWHYARIGDTLRVIVDDKSVDAQLPSLAGSHQQANAALAIAMLLSQQVVPVGTAALTNAPAEARWPGRLQQLGYGPLTAPLRGRTVLLDGGHNVSAAEALADHLMGHRKYLMIVGMLANKDARGWITALSRCAAGVIAVPVPGHAHHEPESLAAMAEAVGIPAATAPNVQSAIAMAAPMADVPVLIAGTLYLAGEVLRANLQVPD